MGELLDAVMFHDLKKVTRILEEGKEGIEIRDRDGRTPFLNAVSNGDIEIASYLMTMCANINAQDKTGYSPLHFACQNQNYELAKLLIESGAKLEIIDVHGNSPLMKAVTFSGGKGEMIQFLLKAGADRDKKNNYGISPLDLAKRTTNFDLKQYFVE